MSARFHLPVALLALCTLFLFATPVHAQFGLTDAGNALTIEFSPATPAPGDTVRVSVHSSLIDIQENDVVWQANGKNIAQGEGVSSASVTAGALGVETRITVTVTASDGTSVSTEATIHPSELDLLDRAADRQRGC